MEWCGGASVAAIGRLEEAIFVKGGTFNFDSECAE